VAAHHFFASSQQPAGLLCKKTEPGRHRQEAPRFIAPVAQLSERSPPKAVVVGETAVRDSERAHLGHPYSRAWEALPAGSTIFRASGSEGIADPTDRESVSLGGASPLSPTSLRHLRRVARLPRRSTSVRRRALLPVRLRPGKPFRCRVV
jgi:hypothetical protein